jgi:2-oxoglutarate ferredoxin oxidoreductase subunit alpha
MAGFSAAGRMPVTATSFPGFALMLESINMAYMMELPMVIVLVQRLGPSTGTATCGAQGDILLVRGIISGGHPVPTICVSDFGDCWNLSASSVSIAARLRTPVILLSSKEMVMTLRSYDISRLPAISPSPRTFFDGEGQYVPYACDRSRVPAFLPVGNERHQVRFTSSTHSAGGLLDHSSDESMANTCRLKDKIEEDLPNFTYFDLDEMEGSGTLIFSYGISSTAAREAVRLLRARGNTVSLLIAKTLFPVPPEYHEILNRYDRVIIAEENLDGQYCEVLFGGKRPEGVSTVGSIGKMVTPRMLVEEVGRG